MGTTKPTIEECAQQQVSAFLQDLLKLCKQHKIAHIGGCGCCGSPWVITESDKSFDRLQINISKNIASADADL